MNYTRQDVEQFVVEENVRFIHLTFCDVYGNLKNKTIMPGELARAFDFGISADAWTIAGFDVSDTRSDLLLRPDPSTLALLPMKEGQDRAIRMFADISWPDGRPFEADTRYILKKTVEEAERKGVFFTFGTEQEFYLLEKDENGEPSAKPFDRGSYMDIFPNDRCEDIRAEICISLEKMGIFPENAHHEEGPGQNEIDIRFGYPVNTADNAMLYRAVVRSISDSHGLVADFSPKPLDNEPGNGMHINYAVTDAQGTDLIEAATAGILNKIPEITVFLNPVEESYRRIGSNKAPCYIAWACDNRSQLIRIPESPVEYRRGELRSPDPCSNPYLALALVIRAALYGIGNDLELQPETELNMFREDKETLKEYHKLPGTLNEARYNAASSEFIKECLPVSVIAAYVK